MLTIRTDLKKSPLGILFELRCHRFARAKYEMIRKFNTRVIFASVFEKSLTNVKQEKFTRVYVRVR